VSPLFKKKGSFGCCLGLFTLFLRLKKFNFRVKTNRFFRDFFSFFVTLEQFVVHPFLQKDTYDGFELRRVLVHRSFLVVFKKNHRKQKDTTNNKVFVFFFTKSKSVQNRECDDVDDFVSHRDGWFCTDDDEWLCDGDGW